MSSITDKLLDAAEMTNTVLSGVELIEGMTDNPDVQKAADILKLVGIAAKAIKSGLKGHTVPTDLYAELNSLKQRIQSNDLAADSELDKKFPNG